MGTRRANCNGHHPLIYLLPSSSALLLHDQGYDVWLGNARGNTYSRTHSTLNSDSRSFWQFSWHEIGLYDLPTIVSHINRTTEAKQIDYIGHSQGVTTFLVMNILREEYQQYFRTVIAMSPIAFLNHLENPYLRFLAKNSEKVELLLELLKIDELLPSNQLNGMLANLMCSESSPSADLCANLLFLAIGPDPIHLNRVREILIARQLLRLIQPPSVRPSISPIHRPSCQRSSKTFRREFRRVRCCTLAIW